MSIKKNRKASAKSKKKIAPSPVEKVSAASGPSSLTPGSVLKKVDREGKVRCECIVEKDGFRYKTKRYGSLSAAATAAAKDLGLSSNSFNGYVFWGLTKRTTSPVERLEHLWQRYSTAIVQLAKGPARVATLERLRKHAAHLVQLTR